MKKSSKSKKDQEEEPAIKLPPRAHVEIVRCRVQLLGRAAPTDTGDGILAMQKPLHELYADGSKVESIISAYTSGVVIRTPADANAGAEELWFPIQDLVECGAMRPIDGRPPTAFVPLSYPEAQRGRNREALFVFVMKRRDIPVSDCWAMVCKSDNAAMALLTACMMAHKNPAGWGSAVDRPPSTIKKEFSRPPPSEEWDGAAAKEAAQWSDKYPRDYYEKPPLQGFFYTPKPDLIQRYALSELKPDLDEEQAMLEDGRMSLADDQFSQGIPGDAYYPGMPEDAWCPCDMRGTPSPEVPVMSVDETDMYGFPPGTLGGFVPESVIYPDDERYQFANGDSEAQHAKEKHGKKKKSKKSKQKEKKLVGKYNYYTDDGGMMIVPQEATRVGLRRVPPEVDEEPFDRRLPQPVNHCVVDEEYDPAWHYNMKSYIRDQQPVNGYTDPVVIGRPYESHIDEFPPADYAMEAPYSDSGVYERRLPVTAGARDAKSDHRMLNRNFIMRQSEDYRRHL